MDQTQAQLLKTIAYYDVFSRPVTAEELSVLHGISFANVQKALQNLEEQGVLEKHLGFWMLFGRKEIYRDFQSRTWLIEQKMQRARRAARILRFVPFVRAVFVCNTVAFRVPKQESDVDVCIVIEPKRLWTTRLLVTLALSVFGLRRGGLRVRDRICLSFYVTTDALDFSRIAIDTDVYLAYWVFHLVPLFDPHHIYRTIQKENTWLRNWGLELPYRITHPRWYVKQGGVSRAWTGLVEGLLRDVFGGMVERIARKFQLKKMRRNTHSVQYAKDTRVIVSDHMLKFHENDRRAQYRDAWVERCDTLDVSVKKSATYA